MKEVIETSGTRACRVLETDCADGGDFAVLLGRLQQLGHDVLMANCRSLRSLSQEIAKVKREATEHAVDQITQVPEEDAIKLSVGEKKSVLSMGAGLATKSRQFAEKRRALV